MVREVVAREVVADGKPYERLTQIWNAEFIHRRWKTGKWMELWATTAQGQLA